ncbi:hypothetical protein DC345_07265 [Paenibacillus taichungensis]|uniref:Lipoprotein n=1 Tax=Paenibacillus taichungensis TaxID=484184 RepID=A0A329QWS9_9BACL|nr:hypothetical protein [Paenibacillus taichungensis]RAW16894.1 hypothetical protein DC345_07265 [Paenibacillus taichungensis]
MKGFSIFLCTVLSIILISGCGTKVSSPGSNSSTDWAYNFVVWNDDIYEILNEEIKSEEIDKEIGEVRKNSDFEGTYGDGFSNKYPVGTKLFKIKKVKTSEYIAIQIEEGIYLKAEDKGKYGGK